MADKSIREADVDPTFIQRYEANVILERDRVTHYHEGVVWPDNEVQQRMWCLAMAVQVMTRELYLTKDGGDAIQLHLDCADRLRSYVNQGR